MAVVPSSELRRALALGGAALAVFAIVGPWAGEALRARIGTRALSLALLLVLVATVPARAGAPRERRLGSIGVALLLVGALASDDPRWLRLLPAWVYALLAGLFAASLRGPGSLLESAARWLVPEAPEFIRGYCRVVTALWVAFFSAASASIAWLAVRGDAAAWQGFTSRTLWIAMAALSVAEFLFRKSWFRHYFHGGPFERLWSRLFPPERTARGRRSLAYIEAHRARIARERSP